MSDLRRPRDVELLDSLEELEPVAVDDIVWRAVRSGRDPLTGAAPAGRWDPGQFDVIYTSFEPDGAIAEIHFHLSRQPVFPSKVSFQLHKLSVKTNNTLIFADLSALESFGVDPERYPDLYYQRTQIISDAAAFLGFDGIIAPNARWNCLNLTIFSDRIKPDDLEILESSDIDFQQWKTKRKSG